MKLAGLLLMAGSFLLFAFVRLGNYKERLEDLKKAILSTQHIKNELSVQPAIIQEMFNNIAKRCSGEERMFFENMSEEMNMLGDRSFYDIWKDNVNSYFSQLCDDERYELIKLGSNLGSCPVDMQIAYISHCQIFMEEILQKEKAQYPQIHRLYIGLSAAAAATVIIVFI